MADALDADLIEKIERIERLEHDLLLIVLDEEVPAATRIKRSGQLCEVARLKSELLGLDLG